MAKKESAPVGTAHPTRAKAVDPAATAKARKFRLTRIDLRLTTGEKADLKQLAKSAGLTLSAYLVASGLHQAGPTDEAFASPNFAEPDNPPSVGANQHEINMKHLASWVQILDENGVGTGPFREVLKQHRNQLASDRLWQQEAQKLGRQLVQATKLGANTSTLQELTDTLTRQLHQRLTRA